MTCKTCQHYYERELIAYCRRNPPIANYTWPTVRNDDFCGEYKLKQSAERAKQIAANKKNLKRPVSETAKRLAAIMGRREDAMWSDKEISAFRELEEIDKADLDLLAKYYASGPEFGRKTLLTLLQNLAGELDQARNWNQHRQPTVAEIYGEKPDPEGWADWLEKTCYFYRKFSEARSWMKDEFNARTQKNETITRIRNAGNG